MGRSSDARSSSAKAFAIVAFIAFVQCSALALLTATQRESAHVIDISGAQRMRSQRIALLAIAARAGQPLPGWRAELDGTLADFTETHRELSLRDDFRTGALGSDGLTDLGRRYARYRAAAVALERHPNDVAAVETIRRDRLPLLARLDAAVHLRTALFERYNRWLVGAILAGLLGQLAAIAFAWRRVMLPTIRTAEAALAELEERRLQFRSVFSQNPDTIGVYDREGTLLHGNRASLSLLGASDVPLIGRHVSKHVADDEIERCERAFAEAVAGRACALDTAFVASDGTRIAVNVNFFPRIEHERVTGVIGVAKDIRPLREAQASARDRSERIAELYELSASTGASWDRQIEQTMNVAARRLGFECGVLGEIRGERLASIGSIGSADFAVGTSRPLADTLARHAIASGDLWYSADLRQSPDGSDAAGRPRPWRAVVVVPLEIEGTTYGTFALGSAEPRTIPLSDGDRHYLRLVAALLASGIARAQHERNLDALAFFDRLTGLPNRTLLDHTLAGLIGASERERGSLCVLYVDLDRFKAVNDAGGHAAGDTVLRIAASRMQSCVRADDTVARIGGDEFVVVLSRSNGRAGANALALRLIDAMEKPFPIDGYSHEISASIGISIYGEDGTDARTLLARADEALYRAKRGGRSRLEFAT
jgi:diguanylate cyclase (GGDEF)-like protein/PAS domain S-box-containing protein